MFSFVKNRFTFYAIAILLIVFSLASPWILGLREGIDMTGGIQMEFSVNGVMTPEQAVTTLKESIIKKVRQSLPQEAQSIISDESLVYKVSGTNHIVVETGINEAAANKNGTVDLNMVESAKTAFNNALKSELATLSGTKIEETRYVNIGASFGDYIKSSGYKTLTLAIIAISLYIMYAFWGSIPGMASWPFAVVTALSLAHDVIVAFGLYVLVSYFLPEFKIDTFFITAMLTILGYSINDTIVVMDRIRSNLRDSKMSKLPFSQIVDTSIWATMRRSLLTSSTVVIVLIAMFFFGPEAIKGFTLALIFGTIVGTYSSVCVASPMLVDLTRKK